MFRFWVLNQISIKWNLIYPYIDEYYVISFSVDIGHYGGIKIHLFRSKVMSAAPFPTFISQKYDILYCSHRVVVLEDSETADGVYSVIFQDIFIHAYPCKAQVDEKS